MRPETITAVTGLHANFNIVMPDKPVFELCRTFPNGYRKQIEEAVVDFIESSDFPKGVDKNGFYFQTLQTIANTVIYGQGNDLWLGIAGNELWTYILGNMSNDVDGKLTYHVHQAWVRKDQRTKPWVKEAWEKLRQRAKDSLCQHLVVFSSRDNSDQAYCRYLGKGFHPYIHLLKEEL